MGTKPTPIPWTVYRCNYCDDGCACGFNGDSVDGAYDECHHTLALVDAELIVRAVNAHDALVNALERARGVLNRLDADDDVFEQVSDALRLAGGES